jgi:hypothetical protein
MDLVDVDGLWEGVEQQMNLVQKDLLKDLMDMSLIKHNKSAMEIIINNLESVLLL